MFFKSKFIRVSLALSILFSLFAVVLADTIRLKDGSIIKGKVVGFSDGKFLIVIGEGNRQRQISYFADEVEKIEFDSMPSTPSNSIRVANSNNSETQPTPKPTVVITNTSNNNSSRNNSNNVIIVGGNRNTNSNQSSSNSNSNSSSSGRDSANTSLPTNSRPQPITTKIRVLADNTSNGWTNASWVVKRGQKIRITGTGRISLGNGRYSTPSGVSSLPDSQKLLKNEPTGCLIAVIGDDNNDFISIGDSREFIAQRDGILFLGVNEGNLDDNSGAFDVTIEVELPNK